TRLFGDRPPAPETAIHGQPYRKKQQQRGSETAAEALPKHRERDEGKQRARDEERVENDEPHRPEVREGPMAYSCFVALAALMPPANSPAGPLPQKWRNMMRGCSWVMCEWMATTLIFADRSALSTGCSSASSIAKSPSATADDGLPANAAQVFTPISAPRSMP